MASPNDRVTIRVQALFPYHEDQDLGYQVNVGVQTVLESQQYRPVPPFFGARYEFDALTIEIVEELETLAYFQVMARERLSLLLLTREENYSACMLDGPESGMIGIVDAALRVVPLEESGVRVEELVNSREGEPTKAQCLDSFANALILTQLRRLRLATSLHRVISRGVTQLRRATGRKEGMSVTTFRRLQDQGIFRDLDEIYSYNFGYHIVSRFGLDSHDIDIDAGLEYCRQFEQQIESEQATESQQQAAQDAEDVRVAQLPRLGI